MNLPTPFLFFCVQFTGRGRTRRKCNTEDTMMKEKDCGAENASNERKSDMCLDVSTIDRAINRLYLVHFGPSGFTSVYFSALFR